jgi:hypothetical protein
MIKEVKLLCLAALLTACGGDSSDVDVTVPDPPVEQLCDYLEIEPNNEFDEANFVDLLPVLDPYLICGDFLFVSEEMKDIDFYHFFLNPDPGQDTVYMNFMITTSPEVFPSIRLAQTVYDEDGFETGEYTTLGVFVGDKGFLVVLDFPVPYDFLNNNDLFVQFEGVGTQPYQPYQYEIEYWNF